MKSFSLRYVAIGFVIITAVGASALPVSDASASTYAAVLALILGSTSVIFMTWRNALPTDTVGQLLQRTETTDRRGRASFDAGKNHL